MVSDSVRMAGDSGVERDTTAGRFVCLLYHDVHPCQTFGYDRLGRSVLKYHVSEATFQGHVRLLEQSTARLLDIGAVRRSFAAGGAAPGRGERGVLVCFDDGWGGAVQRAAPLLERRAIPAIFFVTTAFVGRKFFASAGDLRRLDPLLFAVGSHGATHRMLSSLSASEIRTELGESKARLEDMMGVPVVSLSIPGGAVDGRVVAIARDLGYTEVFTSAIGVNPTRSGRYGIARLGVVQTTSPATLERWLTFRLGRERFRKAALAVPKKLLGMRNYSKLRRVLFGEGGADERLFEP
jgi:peptidoglycan/xylan/chitin deacetylase (PgdA/CDA1 family)